MHPYYFGDSSRPLYGVYDPPRSSAILEQKLGEMLHIIALFQASTISQFVEYLRKDYGDSVSRVFSESLHVDESSGYEQPHSSGSPELTADPGHESAEQLLSSLEQLPDEEVDLLLSNLRTDRDI